MENIFLKSKQGLKISKHDILKLLLKVAECNSRVMCHFQEIKKFSFSF